MEGNEEGGEVGEDDGLWERVGVELGRADGLAEGPRLCFGIADEWPQAVLGGRATRRRSRRTGTGRAARRRGLLNLFGRIKEKHVAIEEKK